MPESPKLGAVSPPHYGSGPGVIYESSQTVFRGCQQPTAELKKKPKRKLGLKSKKSPNCLTMQWKSTAASELQRITKLLK